MLSLGQGWARLFKRAYLGCVKACCSDRLWLDVGVVPGHIPTAIYGKWNRHGSEQYISSTIFFQTSNQQSNPSSSRISMRSAFWARLGAEQPRVRGAAKRWIRKPNFWKTCISTQQGPMEALHECNEELSKQDPHGLLPLLGVAELNLREEGLHASGEARSCWKHS